jgi:NADPH:quinone reductase-like Zn-dependent oxidoreductase
LKAASVLVAVTAWQMLFDHARVSEGRMVFVHGGAGNVGAYAPTRAMAQSTCDRERPRRWCHGRNNIVCGQIASSSMSIRHSWAGLADMLDAKEVFTSVGTVLPLAEARAAHEMLAGERLHERG